MFDLRGRQDYVAMATPVHTHPELGINQLWAKHLVPETAAINDVPCDVSLPYSPHLDFSVALGFVHEVFTRRYLQTTARNA